MDNNSFDEDSEQAKVMEDTQIQLESIDAVQQGEGVLEEVQLDDDKEDDAAKEVDAQEEQKEADPEAVDGNSSESSVEERAAAVELVPPSSIDDEEQQREAVEDEAAVAEFADLAAARNSKSSVAAVKPEANFIEAKNPARELVSPEIVKHVREEATGSLQGRHSVYTIRIGEREIERRYSDFDWLRRALVLSHRGALVPPLPPKAYIGRFDAGFLDYRRDGLAQFLTRVAQHPILGVSEELHAYLGSYEEFANAQRDTQQLFGPLGGALGGAMDNILGFATSLTSQVKKFAGVSEPYDEEDAWFDNATAHANARYDSLLALHSAVSKCSKERTDGLEAMSVAADACAALSTCESEQCPQLSSAAHELSHAFAALRTSTTRLDKAENARFVRVLEYNVKMALEVQHLLRLRRECVMKLTGATQAQLDADAAVRSAPREGKEARLIAVAKAERASKEAEEDYEKVSNAVKDDISRLDANEGAEMKHLFTALAAVLSGETTVACDTWQNVLDKLQHANAAIALPAPAVKAAIVGTELEEGDRLTGGHTVYLIDVGEGDALVQLKRRFSEFAWLHERLCVEYPFAVIPPLPQKAILGTLNMGFIEERRFGLERFFADVLIHPRLSQSLVLTDAFLGTDEQLNEARAKQRGAAAHESAEDEDSQRSTSGGGWFAGLAEKATEFMSSIVDAAAGAAEAVISSDAQPEDEARDEDDPYFTSHLAYFEALSAAMQSLRSAGSALGRTCSRYSGALNLCRDHAAALSSLSEGNGGDAAPFFDAFARLLAASSSSTATCGEAILREFVRIAEYRARQVDGVLKVLRKRAERVSKLQLLCSELRQKQKYAELTSEGAEAASAAASFEEASKVYEQRSDELERVSERVREEIKHFLTLHVDNTFATLRTLSTAYAKLYDELSQQSKKFAEELVEADAQQHKK